MDLVSEIFDAIRLGFDKTGVKETKVTVVYSARPELADFQCNSVFQAAKELGAKPLELAEKIVQNIPAVDGFEFSVCPPAFINVKVSDKRLSSELNRRNSDILLGLKQTQNPLTVVMDYGGANVAKELHIGHLRSPLIGEALARLYRLHGHKVITDTHLGDYGLQMGLTVAQLEDEGYLNGYFDSSKQNLEISLEDLNRAYPAASKRKDVEPEFRKKAEDYTLFIQNKKEPYFTIYKDIRNISIEKIKKNYGELNCFFDLWYGESTAAPYIPETINAFVSQGLARESDGALVVDVAVDGENIPTDKLDENGKVLFKNPMPPMILKKHNGADMYATSDVACIMQRNRDFAPDKIIYIVDFRQNKHFTQVFRASKLAGISPESQELIHVGFGTINGKDGKAFKTREGTTIKLEDIISMIKSKAAEKLSENGIVGDDELARQIGVAALKFGDLSNVVSKDYVFDLDRFASFEGKTGPYIQYTCARINSLLEKANEKPSEIDITTSEERGVAFALLKLTDSYYLAQNQNSLHTVCACLYDLASAFSVLYNNIKINSAETTKKRKYLAITQLVHKALAQGLYVLGMDMPNKM
ncbi:MAG: arginine--tRNA ligase [Clostridia bacterium]|nr:arginine--tRNA ligase [Clostridia bacterium]